MRFLKLITTFLFAGISLQAQLSLDSLSEVLLQKVTQKINSAELAFPYAGELTQTLSTDSIQLLLDRLPKSAKKATLLAHFTYTKTDKVNKTPVPWIEEAIEMAKEINDPKLLFLVYRHHGIYSRSMDKPDEALESFLRSDQYARRAEYTKGRISNFTHFVWLYKLKKDYERAFEYAYKYQEAAENEGLEFEHSYSYYLLGVLYNEIEDYPEAMHQFNLSEELFRETNHIEFIGIILREKADIFRKQNLLDSALIQINLASQFYKENNYAGQEGRFEEKKGQIYFAKSDYQKALQHFLLADSLLDGTPFQPGIIQKIGNTHMALGDYESAESNYLSFLKKLKMRSMSTALTSCYNNLANLYLIKKQYPEARDYALLAKAEAITQDLDFKLFEANEHLATAYFNLKDYEKAFQVQKDIATLSQLTKDGLQINNAEHLRLRYKLKEQRDELDSKHQLAVKQKEWNTKIIWIILALFLIIFFLLNEILRINRRENRALSAKNAKIQELNENLESKVAERTHELSLVYNNTHDLMSLIKVTDDGMILESINNPFLDTLEESKLIQKGQSVLGMKLEDHLLKIIKYSKEETATRLNYFNTVKESKRLLKYETILPVPSGSQQKIYEVTLTPYIDEEYATCTQIIMVAKDITETVTAQKALIESEKRLSTIYNSSQDQIGLFKRTPTGEYLVESINQSGIDLLMKSNRINSPEAVLGLDIKVLYKNVFKLPDAVIEDRMKNIDRVFEEQIIYRFNNSFGSKKSGFELQFESIISPVFSPEGKCTHALLTSRDITEKELAKNKLITSEKSLSSIFNGTSDQMAIIDIKPNGTLLAVEANKALKDIWALIDSQTQGEMMLNKPLDYYFLSVLNFDPEKKKERFDLFYEVIQSKKEVNYEEFFQLGEKQSFVIDVTVSPILNTRNECTKLLFVMRDVTLKHRAKERMISKILEAEDQERSRLAKELHDGLGQNLTAASINFDLVKNNMPDCPLEIKQNFERGLDFLHQAIHESRNMAHNLMPQSITDFGYVLTVESLIENLQDSTGIKFSFYDNLQSDRLNPDVELSLYRITQEAINNIMKHSEATEVDIQLIKHSKSVILTIEDNGKGMNDSAKKMNSFGLNSMKNRASAHSGVLDIESTPGRGTSITLEIPI